MTRHAPNKVEVNCISESGYSRQSGILQSVRAHEREPWKRYAENKAKTIRGKSMKTIIRIAIMAIALLSSEVVSELFEIKRWVVFILILGTLHVGHNLYEYKKGIIPKMEFLQAAKFVVIATAILLVFEIVM